MNDKLSVSKSNFYWVVITCIYNCDKCVLLSLVLFVSLELNSLQVSFCSLLFDSQLSPWDSLVHFNYPCVKEMGPCSALLLKGEFLFLWSCLFSNCNQVLSYSFQSQASFLFANRSRRVRYTTLQYNTILIFRECSIYRTYLQYDMASSCACQLSDQFLHKFIEAGTCCRVGLLGSCLKSTVV